MGSGMVNLVLLFAAGYFICIRAFPYAARKVRGREDAAAWLSSILTPQAIMCLALLVNAGAVPPDHWYLDPELGGGRIVGEGCHWIDLLSCLADAPVRTVHAEHVGESSGALTRGDHTVISLTFGDGSISRLSRPW